MINDSKNSTSLCIRDEVLFLKQMYQFSFKRTNLSVWYFWNWQKEKFKQLVKSYLNHCACWKVLNDKLIEKKSKMKNEL